MTLDIKVVMWEIVIRYTGDKMKITHRQLRHLVLEACGVCSAKPEPEHDYHDDSTELQGAGRVKDDVGEMDPEEAFIAGFVMGQSGDFDGMIEPPTVVDAFHPHDVESREDAWAGGDNLDDARIETGESNAGPHARLQHRSMREGKSKISRSALLDIIREELGVINEFDNEDPLEPGDPGYEAQQARDAGDKAEALKGLAEKSQKWNTGGKSGEYEIVYDQSVLHLIFKIDGVNSTASAKFGDQLERKKDPGKYAKKMTMIADMKYKDPNEVVKKYWNTLNKLSDNELGDFSTTVARKDTAPGEQYDNVDWVKKNQTRIFSDILDGKGYLKRGSKDSNRVTALQTLLVAAGEKPGKIDGDYGGGTYNAVRSFQSKLRKIEKQTRQGRKGASKNVRISIDGVAGRQTIVSLLDAGPSGPANTLVAVTGREEDAGDEGRFGKAGIGIGVSSAERNAAIALTTKLNKEDDINVTAKTVHTWLASGKTEDEIRTLAKKA